MTTLATTTLKARGLKKYYGKDTGLVRAVNGVDLDIEPGSRPSVRPTRAPRWRSPIPRESRSADRSSSPQPLTYRFRCCSGSGWPLAGPVACC